MSDNIFNKWAKGLEKTRKTTFGRIATIIGTSEITDESWDEVEAMLIKSDIGIQISIEIIEKLKDRVYEEGIASVQDFKQAIRELMLERLTPPPEIRFDDLTVILVVGVNGSGKTTNMAKLGKRYQDQGLKVVFGAADTYRAAAIDQLQVWGDRLNIPVITGQSGGDPGAVTYDSIQAGVSRKSDIVMIDTAGRLHTRFNLMEELKKVYRVAGKALEGAPHHVWLVMDATTGQNALQQAKAFKKAVEVDGVILAKLDSSAKGGMAFSIQRELELPILYAGLGESAEDLIVFDPEAFVDSILIDFQ